MGLAQSRGDGVNRVILTMPTGMGKTATAAAFTAQAVAAGERVVIFTNRRLMVTQLRSSFEGYGIACGTRAADHLEEPHHPVQISSIQTEHSRVVRRKLKDLAPADVVFIDEGHLHTGQMSQRIADMYHEAGAFLVYMTATPLGMAGVAERLLVAGSNSEGRACGALVMADHFGPDEPDLRQIGRKRVDDEDGYELSDEEEEEVSRKAIMVPGIFARVWDSYVMLNPTMRPTILFAPGVPESLWFAEQFSSKGVSAAHISGEEVWVDGQIYRNDRDARDRVLEGSRAGRIKVLTNRFVLREGIDAPWLAHGIFATVFGSLQTYLQSGGRLLRASPGLERVTFQDHGGNWHRFGSLNQDREWDHTLTGVQAAGMRINRIREKKEPEPWRCPQCTQIMNGLRCRCGFVLDPRRKSRPVAQSDGRLVQMPGDVYRPRRTERREDTAAKWEAVYWRARNSKRRPMSFRGAAGLFFKENGYHPPTDLPLMPTNDRDWVRLVRDVKMETLTSIPPRRGRGKRGGL